MILHKASLYCQQHGNVAGKSRSVGERSKAVILHSDDQVTLNSSGQVAEIVSLVLAPYVPDMNKFCGVAALPNLAKSYPQMEISAASSEL